MLIQKLTEFIFILLLFLFVYAVYRGLSCGLNKFTWLPTREEKMLRKEFDKKYEEWAEWLKTEEKEHMFRLIQEENTENKINFYKDKIRELKEGINYEE